MDSPEDRPKALNEDMSPGFPPRADIVAACRHVRFVPILLRKGLMASARSDSVVATRFAAEGGMMGRLNHDQGQLFYSFSLEEGVPDDHLVREIAAVLDLAWVRVELAPYYSRTGRPSIDPEMMIRMLIIGYVFAIRSERALCRDVQVNFAYRWFCG